MQEHKRNINIVIHDVREKFILYSRYDYIGKADQFKNFSLDLKLEINSYTYKRGKRENYGFSRNILGAKKYLFWFKWKKIHKGNIYNIINRNVEMFAFHIQETTIVYHTHICMSCEVVRESA